MANQANLLALDNALRTSTSTRGLITWASEHPIELKRGDERFKVESDQLPAEIRSLLNGRKFRSAVLNTTTQATRLEVCYASAKRSLWNFLDSASVGFNGRMILFYFFGVLGTECLDFTHRRVRTFENALTQAQVTFAKKEWEIVLSYLDGPFHVHQNYTEFVEFFQADAENVHAHQRLLQVSVCMACANQVQGQAAAWVWFR